MTINGRKKGSNAERALAAIIQAWWRQRDPECIFKRTPSSGGWASPEARAHFKTSGDLVTTAAWWPWCVEIKHREGWSREWLEKGRNSPVWSWWEQTQTAAAESDQWPMLFVRKNRTPWLLMLSDRDPAIEGPLYGARKLGRRSSRMHAAWSRDPVITFPHQLGGPWRVGDHHPIVFTAEQLFAMPPRLFALRDISKP
jgi:hypothetical protein